MQNATHTFHEFEQAEIANAREALLQETRGHLGTAFTSWHLSWVLSCKRMVGGDFPQRIQLESPLFTLSLNEWPLRICSAPTPVF